MCEANVDVALIEKHWDSLVHLAASVMSGHASAVAALARFGSAAQGDPIYEAGVQLGRLLRTAFLADYFVKDAFRNELRRVLNRGEAVNALKRAIYTGRISPAQAKRVDEMQAVADALSLMANIVMAWNPQLRLRHGRPSPFLAAVGSFDPPFAAVCDCAVGRSFSSSAPVTWGFPCRSRRPDCVRLRPPAIAPRSARASAPSPTSPAYRRPTSSGRSTRRTIRFPKEGRATARSSTFARSLGSRQRPACSRRAIAP
ncbi:Tn3 family transposase [Piscinibacter defluvii]|uniref:Tn3 family transposase n=1 Tax=Piscinibacter defluvii TaxID=1796922 RepID=UPI0035BF77F9